MSRWSAWGDDSIPQYDESDRYDGRAGRTCSPTHGDPCGECSACSGEEADDSADDDSADDESADDGDESGEGGEE